MAEDMFGDSSLFEEFDKDREPSGSFIFYETDEHGSEDRSKILFQMSDSSSDESDGDEPKVKGDSESCTAKKETNANGEHNGISEGSGESTSDESEDDVPVVSKDRLEKSTTFKLNFERNKFKRFCNIIDSTRYIHDEQSAAVQVLFQNNKFSRKYKTQIEGYIKHLIDEDARAEYETLQKLDLKSTAPSCVDMNNKLPASKRTNTMFQAHSIIGCSQFYHDFVLDTLGWPMVEYNPSLTDSWDIPVYEQAFTDSLPIDIALIKAKEKQMERERSKPKCWNCGGDHMLSDCKEPKNQQKINESRKAMMATQQQSKSNTPKSGRYHKEANADPKYAKYKPGHLSKELREALGIGDDRLPVYIYKMRAIGYPPGWMEDAKTDPGLTMFDKDGNETEEGIENGEIVPEAPQLDVNKVIEYPGFTVENPPDVVDEASLYGLPELQIHQLKSTLIAQTEMQQSLKRDQEQLEEQTVKRPRLDTSDMDLDAEDGEVSNSSFVPPLPPDTPPGKPPVPDNTPPPTPEESARRVPPSFSRESSQAPSEPRSDSPSLEELEERYKLLQKSLLTDEDTEDGELIVLDSCDDESQSSAPAGDQSGNPIEIDSQGDEHPGNVSTNPIDVMDDSMDSEFVKPKLARAGSTTSIQTFGELGTGSPLNSHPGTPVHSSSFEKPSFKGSLSVSKDFGTPILKRPLSMELLPADTNFAQGIEDHIPFENLPDSTGTFEKMRKLLGKIRNKMPSRKKKL